VAAHGCEAAQKYNIDFTIGGLRRCKETLHQVHDYPEPQRLESAVLNLSRQLWPPVFKFGRLGVMQIVDSRIHWARSGAVEACSTRIVHRRQ
jgi:hypothetical protein